MDLGIDHDLPPSGHFDASNPYILPSSKKKHKNATDTGTVTKKSKHIKKNKKSTKILSKKQRRRLEQIVNRRDRKSNRAQLLEELSKHKLPQEVLSSFTPFVQIQSHSKALDRKLRKEQKEKKQKNSDEDIQSENEELEQELHSESEQISSEDEDDEVTEMEQEHKDNPVPDKDSTPKPIQLTKEKEPKKVLPLAPRPHNYIPVHRKAEIEAARQKLPIVGEEQIIMETINENIITILSSETGSGKTTQIPQFLYEAGYATGNKIIGITEPRRVAAIAMANRVGTEMNLSSEVVSYQIRFEGNAGSKTKIKFMTDGVLLKEMKKDFLLTKYSVICIDEAHERSLFTDILIGLLSRVVNTRHKANDPLRLVIMSATLRVEDFISNKILFPKSPSVVRVPSRQFTVQTHFSKITPRNYILAAEKKVRQIHKRLPPGGILVFVTGQEEVKTLCNRLSKCQTRRRISHGKTKLKGKGISVANKSKDLIEIDLDKLPPVSSKSKTTSEGNQNEDESDEDTDEDEEIEDDDDEELEPLHVVPLYSMLPSIEQQKVFSPPPPNTRLCVISTNVAETSLTIPAIRYVVDTGKTKVKVWDKSTGVQSFRIQWCSKASAEQRTGRAGRTGPGHCYRLYSPAVFDAEFQEFSQPEIADRPVDDVVLFMKSMSINQVINFPFPTRPSLEQLVSAENLLLNLGGIELNGNSKVSTISELGKTMSQLPLSPRFGKMVAISFSHNIVEYTVTLVAALTVQEVLLDTPVSSSEKQTEQKWSYTRRKWSGVGASHLLGDPMVLLRAVGAFEFAGGSKGICSELGLRYKAMIEIRKLRKQLTNEINLLSSSNEVPLNPKMLPPNDEQSNSIRQLLLSSFPDRIAKRIEADEVPSGPDAQKKYKNGYWTGELSEPVFLHKTSVLRHTMPEWIIYQEAFEVNNKVYLRGITGIEPHWIPILFPSLCTMSKPLKDKPPFRDPTTDKLMCYVNYTFGKQGWKLPAVEVEFSKATALKTT